MKEKGLLKGMIKSDADVEKETNNTTNNNNNNDNTLEDYSMNNNNDNMMNNNDYSMNKDYSMNNSNNTDETIELNEDETDIESNHMNHMNNNNNNNNTNNTNNFTISGNFRDISEMSRSKAMKSLAEESTNTKVKLGCGVLLLLLAIILSCGAVIIDHLVEAKIYEGISKMLIMDSNLHEGFEKWVTNDYEGATKQYQSLSFFHITNPEAFLTGVEQPHFEERGPYVFQKLYRNVDISFSVNQELVQYSVNTKYIFDETKSTGQLDDIVTIYNLPYVAAVGQKGSESNLLKVGSQEAMSTIHGKLQNELLPTMRENAVVNAIKEAVMVMEDALATVRYPEHGIETRWGGGCIDLVLGVKHCGFGSLSYISVLLSDEQRALSDFWQLCLETKIATKDAIPYEIIIKLWDETDPLSLFNTDRTMNGTSVIRHGISDWMWGDVEKQNEIMNHFEISEVQFSKLKEYIFRIYNSDLLTEQITNRFLERVTHDEKKAVKRNLKTWEDLMYRQWSTGDVISRLQHEEASNPSYPMESMLPETPPEFGHFMNTLPGRETDNWLYSTTNEEDNIPRWSTDQSKCIFDLFQKNTTFFEETFVGIQSFNPNKLEPFDKPQLSDAIMLRSMESCINVEKDLPLLQKYVEYLGEYFVKAELEADIINNNGGLLSTRTVGEFILGHSEPMLRKALRKDDPRYLNFGLQSSVDDLESEPLCRTSADVENPYTACKISAIDVTTGERTYRKVPSIYHTGRNSISKSSELFSFQGNSIAKGYWSDVSIPIRGGARVLGNKIQHGFSEGQQFPPFNQVNESSTLTLFISSFVAPFNFVYDKDVNNKGIDMKRFKLDPGSISNRRVDLNLLNRRDSAKRNAGVFNATDLMGMPFYVSKVFDSKLNIENLVKSDKKLSIFENTEAFVDVEPLTGKSMNVNIGIQISSSTKDLADKLDVWHKDVYKMDYIPVMYQRQFATVGDEDATMFKDSIYAGQKLGKIVSITCTVIAVLSGLAGLFFVIRYLDKKRNLKSIFIKR